MTRHGGPDRQRQAWEDECPRSDAPQLWERDEDAGIPLFGSKGEVIKVVRQPKAKFGYGRNAEA